MKTKPSSSKKPTLQVQQISVSDDTIQLSEQGPNEDRQQLLEKQEIESLFKKLDNETDWDKKKSLVDSILSKPMTQQKFHKFRRLVSESASMALSNSGFYTPQHWKSLLYLVHLNSIVPSSLYFQRQSSSAKLRSMCYFGIISLVFLLFSIILIGLIFGFFYFLTKNDNTQLEIKIGCCIVILFVLILYGHFYCQTIAPLAAVMVRIKKIEAERQRFR